VRGRRVVVRGAIKGDLVGEEAVLLEEGARVVGDVRAPRVAIAQGALVRGYVQTGEGDGSASRAVRAQTAVRPATATQPQPRTAAVAKAPAPAPARQAPNQPPNRAVKPAAPSRVAASATDGAAIRRPPPPIVPALKKAKGQIAKKKER
jgi:Polymer-forming cytoskeletal